MNDSKTSTLIKHLSELGKVSLVCFIILQMFMQTPAALAQAQPVLEVYRPQPVSKSKIKPKAEESDVEDFLPRFEQKARKTFSDAFGVNVPLPQVFGENGSLQALLAGKNSAADKNKEIIDSVLNKGENNNSSPRKIKNEFRLHEAAISLNAPVLNAGTIAGSLRVAKEVPFNLGKNFRVTENLYTAGSPDILTLADSKIQGIVNDESDDLSNKYSVYLSGGEVSGNIHIHSVPENIFNDIPNALPKPNGSQYVEINSAEDIQNIKDWNQVRILTINTKDLTVPIPAGNYESIILNAPNKLVFSGGNYNFSETIVLQKGSSIQIDGKTTLGIAKNLIAEDVSVVAGKGISLDSVKINVLGNSVILSGKTQIEGFLRAANANVIINENSKVIGQVVSGSLVMNGGTVAESLQTNSRVFGLKQYLRTTGAPNVYTDTFVRNTCQAPYTLKIYNGNLDGTNRISSATVKLNGSTVVAQNAFNQNIGYIERTVVLNQNNTLEVRLTSNPGSFFNLEIIGKNCGTNDTTAPVLTVTSPQNNSTTTASAINVQGTATDASGISQVLVNNTQATYSAVNNTWLLSNFPLNIGVNQISVKAIDNAGNQTTQTVTVTRQQTSADVTPPVLTITSPQNNSTTTAQTITVTGTAVDTGTNASGLAGVTVNGQNVTLSLDGTWTISGVSLNSGANTITARATDNAGNISTQTITVNRENPDTTSPILSIVSPANNSETTSSTITVSGTVTDTGTNSSGVASVTVNGQTATISGSGWTIENIALSIGTNTIIANAIDNAGNSSSEQITVIRREPDTTAPTITIVSPGNNFETNDASAAVSGTVTDTGTNASGVQGVTVNGQTANLNNGAWSLDNVSLNIGSNTITVKATDVAGNEATATVTVIRREPDTTAPTVTITSPVNDFATVSETITVQGTVTDSNANTSGIQSVAVNGVNATVTGNTWTAQNVSLNLGSNAVTAVAKDNNNNTGSVSITVVRNPPDTTPPTITITSPVNNFETFDPQVTITGTVTDTGAGATGVQSITVNGVAANYVPSTNSWSATINLTDGVNAITVIALDNAPTPNQSQSVLNVTKVVIQPPTLTITNPQNGAFLSANSVTVAGTVSSNKPDMTFTVNVNGETANLAGREYTKTQTLTDGTNVINVTVTDALGQQAQQSITVTNDKTPPTVILTNVPQVVNPGESYTIGATATDTYGISEVEFTVNGASISKTSATPYQFTLNVPLNQAPNQILNISAIARDNAGLSATSTARVTTSGPSGVTGYVFDDTTGYVVQGAEAKLNNQTPVLTDEIGLYSFVANTGNGTILLSKPGYTSVERSYLAAAGAGVEVFDARLTPLDSKVNSVGANEPITATDSGNKIQLQLPANSFPAGSDVRVTSVSPQGLGNLLPFGWSPIPEAVFDIRLTSETQFSNRNFPSAATLTIPQVQGLASDLPIVLVRYNNTAHAWQVVRRDIFAGANGMLQTNISVSGQYAFVVADTGTTAPPQAVAGENLPASAPAGSEQLENATASATATPGTALYSNTAKSKINFIAESPAKLPSGVSIEASFSDTYLTIIGRNLIAVDRPSQDFVLYSYPAVVGNNSYKLGAFFVAKPIRTDFGVTDLLNAKVRVDIRSGRLSQSGVLIGQTGGVVRGAESSEFEIPTGAVSDSQVVFFDKIPVTQTGVALPEGYEIVGAFDVNLASGRLTQSGKISMPAISGDNSKIVVAKVISIAGQQGLKIVGRVVENDSRLETSIVQPAVPSGINLSGIIESGKYVFVRIPVTFGYITGTVSSQVPNTQAIKINNNQTPFVDLVSNNGNYTIITTATGANTQVDAISLNNDATGFVATAVSGQDAIANLPIGLAGSTLSVQTVTPANNSTNIVVTTPVTVTFNKPLQTTSVTGSNIKLVTASGNPVITTISIPAGNRSVILTPSSNLQGGVEYKVQVSTAVKDIYGNALSNNFESKFRTATPIPVSGQLQASQIRISYPNEFGLSTISIPAGSVPSGSTILVINNSSGATVSTVATSSAVELLLQARVGDDIEIIIRQPDGTEYRVKQAAYRRADGFVAVGANGGTVTSDDGTLVLQIPAGAITGQAEIKMTFAPESSITAPREGEMAPGEMNYLGGVRIEAKGNFTNDKELHLELPSPVGVQEGQRALIMKPSKINYQGTEIETWETITSAKVENGKIKSTSPPFIGVTLVSTIITGVIPLMFYVFIPARQRVVMGVARKRKNDGTTEPVVGAFCSISIIGDQPRIYAESQPKTGKFALSHNNIQYSSSDDVEVLCVKSQVTARALAYPYAASQGDVGIFGFENRYATVIFQADSPVNLPPQITIEGKTLGLNQGDVDTLLKSGKVVAGTRIEVKVNVTPAVEEFTGNLFVNGSLTNQLEWTKNKLGNSEIYTTEITASTVGSYGISIKGKTVASQPNTHNTATYNFIAVSDPNNCLSNSEAPPLVLNDSSLPRQGAKQVDVGTKIHLEFSEPVKGFKPGDNIFLTEIETGEIITGTVTSGDLPVSESSLKCQIDFTPERKLKGGKEYEFTLKNTVKDTNDVNLNEDFNRTFTTFQGSVITPAPIPDNSYRIATFDNYIVTAEASGIHTNINGNLKIYDFSTIFGASTDGSVDNQNQPVSDNDFKYKTPIGEALISHRPIALTVFSDEFPALGSGERIIAAVTTTAVPDIARPNNLWLYDITTPEKPVLVGVTSLSIPFTQTEIPVSIAVHKKRAYVGNVSFGGALVVDLEETIRIFSQEMDLLLSGNNGNTENAISQIRIKAVSPQRGFGQEARIQRGVYSSGPGQPSPVRNVSVITQNTGNNVSPVAYLLSTYLPKLISFDFNTENDGLLDFSDTDGNNKDDRWLVSKDLEPLSYLQDLQAVSKVPFGGVSKDLLVAISANSLFVFDVTNPNQNDQQDNPKQYSAKTFVSLGLKETDQAIKVDVEGTLAYVLFTDKVAVIDISNPDQPYLSTVIYNIGSGLRWMAVKDGLVYTIGQAGIHVSVGRSLVQMVAYGIDTREGEDKKVCGNPVVIKSDTNEMAQPAGFYFQAFGHDRPLTAKIIVREVTLENDARRETVIETIRDVEIFQTVAQNITAGRARMAPREIDPSKIYTAEIILDEATPTELRSKQIEIPFSQLITYFPNTISLDKTQIFGEVNNTRLERTGRLAYGLAGAVKNVKFEVRRPGETAGTLYPLYERFISRTEDRPKERKRPFGIIVDYLKQPMTLAAGRYTFKYSATFLANDKLTEVKEGEFIVGDDPPDLRQPGSMVVNNVEVSKGNLALSENDLFIKGRGLSLEFNRSYNSLASNVFNPLGYGWRHNYQMSLSHTEADDDANGKIYYVRTGEGGMQTFDEKDIQNGEIKSSAPYLGTLKKNADGSFDYYAKSGTKYHFRNALTANAVNLYMGNISYIEDLNGNKISFEYDLFGRLRTVKDSSSRKLTFDYELAVTDFADFQVEEQVNPECPSYREFLRITRRIGQSQLSKKWRITRIHDETGLAIDYEYDDDGNLKSVTRNADDTANAVARNRISEYTYKPFNDSSENSRFPHLLKTVKSPNNFFNTGKTTYTYEITPAGVPMVKSIDMPESVKNSFDYQFDSEWKITQTEFTDGNNNKTKYKVTDGKYVTEIVAPGTAATTLQWTDFGQMLSSVDPEGKITKIGYDLDNNPISQQVTGFGNTISTVTTFTTVNTSAKKFTKMSSFTDGNNNKTTYSVNQTTGNIDRVDLPNGKSVSFYYHSNGDLKETIDQYGTKTQFSNYDSYGNPRTITKLLGGGQTQTITQTFDSRSRLRSSNDSLGLNITISYDNLDRPTRKITSDPTGFRETLTEKTIYRPEGQIERQSLIGTEQNYSIENIYDDLSRLEKSTESVSGYNSIVRSFSYDKNSNLLTEQNRRGISTERKYNALNHLTKIEQGGKVIWDASGSGDIDKVGNPRKVKDLYGNVTEYKYDGFQRLEEKILPEGYTEKLEYDNNNNITASFDRNGNKTEYKYDSLNRVSEVKDALGRITTWDYDDANHQVTKELVTQKLKEITKMDGLERPVLRQVIFGGNTYETLYEYSGRNVSITDARGNVIKKDLSGYGEVGKTEVVGANPVYKTETRYSSFGAVSRITDALNRVTNITNDGFNRQTSIDYNSEFSESFEYDGEGLLTKHTDRRGVTTTQTYDDLGRKTLTKVTKIAPESGFITTEAAYYDSESKEVLTDANSHLTTYQYDGLRRVKQITNADQKIKKFEYDGENLIYEGDFYNSSERRTRYVYDKLNRVKEVYDRSGGFTKIDYSSDDLVKTITDRRGNITTEKYDELGRLVNAESYGKIVGYTYDGNNNRLTQQDGLSNTTTFTYDNLNRLESVKRPNETQAETYTYDAVGNLKTHSDERGQVVKNAKYDSLNQLEEITDGENNTTKFDYDGEGLLLSKTEPKGEAYKTTYTYNALGSLTSVNDAEQGVWTFEYDNAQNLRFVKDALSSTDAGRVTEYQYDSLNRPTKTIQPQTPEHTPVTTYTYDNNSNLVTVTDPKGQIAEMRYDKSDRLDDATYKNAANQPQIYHDFEYDKEDNLKKVTETRGGQSRTYERNYDTRNRLIQTRDAFGKSVSFTYDTANNLKTLTDSANRTTSYNYDARNRLDTVTQNGANVADYDWYADGLLKKVTYQNNTTRNYTYDNADRVTQITNNFAGNRNESFEYGYDANSNRISEIKKADGKAFRTISYDYDKLDRLTRADYKSNVQPPPNPSAGQQTQYSEPTALNTYGYDAVGNRINEKKATRTETVTLTTDAGGATTSTRQTTTSEIETTTATYDALNRLKQLNEPSGVGTFQYDANGNLAEAWKNGTSLNKYEYDSRNQLTKVRDGLGNELAGFDYDFERKRLSKTGASGYESYVYAGKTIVGEYNAFGTRTASYTVGAGEVVKSEFGNTENNFHFADALGSVTSLTDANGSLTTANEYNAFGEVAPSGNQTANSIGYTGQRLDSETGLMALGNGERYYSPTLARFIQQDSFAGSTATPQSLNRFAYTHNNPNKYVDPTGNYIESVWDAFSLGLGVYSFQDNIKQGNYWSAALDAVGIIADTAALILPIVPGGVGAVIKASRAIDKAISVVQTIDRVGNAGQAAYNAGEAFGSGDLRGGLLNTTFALLGAKGAVVSAKDINRVSEAANDLEKTANDVEEITKATRKAGGEATELLNAKNNPDQITGIIQKEAKAQKASMMEDLKAKDNVKTDYSDVAKQRLAEAKANYGDGGNWGGDGFGKYDGNLMDGSNQKLLSPAPEGVKLADDEIVVYASNPTVGSFKLRDGVDTKPIGNIVEPGKSVTIATDLNIKTEYAQIFGEKRIESLTRSDVLSAASVKDIRAAGFDVIYAPTRTNHLHARIIPAKNNFDSEEARDLLSLAFDKIATGKGKRR